MRGKKEFFKRAKEKEEQLGKELENSEKLGCKDTFAMLFSAFLVLFPISVAAIAVISIILLLVFRAI